MMLEHRRRASEDSSTKSRSIPAHNYPSRRAAQNAKSSPISSIFCKWSRPLLSGSAPQREFDETHAKQRTGKILAGARMPIRIFEIWPKSSRSLALVNRQNTPGFAISKAFLIETAQQSETAVNHSKQTLGKILTETRMAPLARRKSSNSTRKSSEDAHGYCSSAKNFQELHQWGMGGDARGESNRESQPGEHQRSGGDFSGIHGRRCGGGD